MGPRPFSRGNFERRSVERAAGRGFNGAAAFQPRKPAPPRDTIHDPGHFNGAAAFQPRKRR